VVKVLFDLNYGTHCHSATTTVGGSTKRHVTAHAVIYAVQPRRNMRQKVAFKIAKAASQL
jgi:hypothetical protein